MDLRSIKKLTGPLARRLTLVASRCVVSLVQDSFKMQNMQIRLLADETMDNVEHFQPYGLTAHPHGGAEGVALSIGGRRAHSVVIVVDDRRYRLAGLERGEVALYDDLGQRVHLTRSGVVIDGAGQPVTVTNTPKMRVEAAEFECTGSIKDRCDSGGKTMDGMRSTYDIHDHNENDNGGPTDPPNQRM